MPPKPRDPFNFDEFSVAAGAGNFVKRPMAEHVTKGAPTEKIKGTSSAQTELHGSSASASLCVDVPLQTPQ
ncbi:hypothetical protein HaLaN_11841 [Haematococcus lacustris]|uniref:Uncharacterized protein n=1 Tax=Haematococcus lacustris TaxID=44745 RepID=A0A699Z8L9_HAELA|nr:hypothetical protein HaLaN_11841 [Haematococcus lacustris]